MDNITKQRWADYMVKTYRFPPTQEWLDNLHKTDEEKQLIINKELLKLRRAELAKINTQIERKAEVEAEIQALST